MEEIPTVDGTTYGPALFEDMLERFIRPELELHCRLRGDCVVSSTEEPMQLPLKLRFAAGSAPATSLLSTPDARLFRSSPRSGGDSMPCRT
jgi:hypothetical protein